MTVIENTEAEAKAKAIAIRAGFIDAKKKQPALTLRAAIDNYIGDRDNALSPATVRGYITIKNNAFAPVMDTDIFSVRNWQSAVNVEAGARQKRFRQKQDRYFCGFVFAASSAVRYALARLRTDKDISRCRTW